MQFWSETAGGFTDLCLVKVEQTHHLKRMQLQGSGKSLRMCSLMFLLWFI